MLTGDVAVRFGDFAVAWKFDDGWISSYERWSWRRWIDVLLHVMMNLRRMSVRDHRPRDERKTNLGARSLQLESEYARRHIATSLEPRRKHHSIDQRPIRNDPEILIASPAIPSTNSGQ